MRRNSITWYFAIAFGTAVAVGMALYHALNALVPLDDEHKQPFVLGVVQPVFVASLVRVLDVSPPDLRDMLAVAASGPDLSVSLSQKDPREGKLETHGSDNEGITRLKTLLGRGFDPMIVAIDHFTGTGDVRRGSDARARGEAVVVGLRDGTWAVFVTRRSVWGVAFWERVGAHLLVLGVAIALVSFIGAYQLARPINAFAVAARRFGTDPKAPPIIEQGPKEMRRAIAAFNVMQSQIQRFVSGQAAMFAAISHDLRTPLTRMRLRGEFISDVQQQERLFRDVDDMQSMIDAALAFLRDNAAEEATTSVDLPELLRTISDNYADMGAEVSYDGPDHLAFRGRPVALKRAFGNLVDNAVKYGRAPSIVLRESPGSVLVVVSDQGPGIPDRALEEVFTPFQRVETSRNRLTGGIGLGLTAARAGFRAHGGDVVLANAPIQGLRASGYVAARTVR